MRNRAEKTDLPCSPRGPCVTSAAYFLCTGLCIKTGCRTFVRQPVNFCFDDMDRSMVFAVRPYLSGYFSVRDFTIARARSAAGSPSLIIMAIASAI